jgi:hypothetical protein
MRPFATLSAGDERIDDPAFGEQLFIELRPYILPVPCDRIAMKLGSPIRLNGPTIPDDLLRARI